MMSLSENLSAVDKGSSWVPYEMPPVDMARASRDNAEAGFVSLQLGQRNKAAFIPLLENKGNLAGVNAQATLPLEEKMALVEKEAYDKGFAQGEKDGYELGETRARKVVEKIENLLDDMVRLKSGVVRQYEKDMLATIFSIAEKVIHTHVQFDETAVKGTILAALDLTAEKREVTLKINPEDFEYVEKLRPELFSRHVNVKSIIITSDPAISRGGCRLETAGGDVDATVESQLEIIQQSLKEAYTG